MKLEENSWVDIREYFKDHDSVIIGIGSEECHGMHNPLGVDTIVPNYILDKINEKSDILILPTMPYGSTDYFMGFDGTVSIGTELLYQVIKKIIDSMVQYGAKRFIFLNGHGGNVTAIEKACLDLDEMGYIGCCLNWWLMAWDLNPEWTGGHGGAEETSAILAINEKLVHLDRIEDNEFYHLSKNIKAAGLRKAEFKGVSFSMPKRSIKMTNNGWVGNDHPRLATKEWGEEMLASVVDYIVEFIEEFKTIELEEKK